MTYNELKAQVASLGFERTVADGDGLRRAVERGLHTLFTDLPQVRVTRIYISAPRLTNVYKTVRHNGRETEAFFLHGTAFSFRPHGDGAYTLYDGDAVTRVSFFATDGVVRGGISSGNGRIIFEGEKDYTVTSLATFGGRYGASLTDVPEYAEERDIDLATVIPDFGGVATQPACVSGNMSGTRLTVRTNILNLPFLLDGEVEVEYYRLPRFTAAKDEPLDLPPGTEHLLAFLVASFIWLDDDAEKAQYYMALYRDGLLTHRKRLLSSRDRNYRTNGWA
ncbi:MAG: hypothetical protein IKV43_00215 [Clostridia bacterium]|nr:hypothetical protein [Clostridia bacterium]